MTNPMTLNEAIALLATENVKHPRFNLLLINKRDALAQATLEQRIRDDIEDAVHHSPERQDPCAEAGRFIHETGHGPRIEILIQTAADEALKALRDFN